MTVIKKYKPEHDEWITRHIEDGTYGELAERFKGKFHMNATGTALRRRAARLGLHKIYNSSRMRPGEVMNKEAVLPVGSERITKGIVWVKVEDVRSRYNKKIPGGYQNGGNWRKKAYINWENAYGKVPEGKRLVYLDGDSTNCSADNLYFTTVGIQMHIARQGYQNGHKDLTLAAIKWYELHNELKKF